VLIVLTLALHTATAGEMCSIIPFSVFRTSTSTYFVGSATPDTIATGRGATKPSTDGGHWGRGLDRAVFGQVVRVERLGGKDSAAIEHAFGRLGSREVVLVPWDYAPDCEPVLWSRGARWAATDTAGFYRATIRPPSEWLNGRPVLDVFRADIEPYPHALFFQRGYRGTGLARTSDALTPAEYFAFYAASPTELDARERPANALATLEQWIRDNPRIATRYPATESIRRARNVLTSRQ
jgi:hypothetical protein